MSFYQGHRQGRHGLTCHHKKKNPCKMEKFNVCIYIMIGEAAANDSANCASMLHAEIVRLSLAI